MKKSERRRFIRHLLVNPVRFRVEGDSKQFEKTETVNVSEGGLMFTTREKVKTGSVIELEMPLYDKSFKIKATVVHCEDDKADGQYRIGVAFTSYADAFKIKLIEQIYLIEEYRVLRSLQLGKDITLEAASKEWIERYFEGMDRKKK